jgi:threonine dehydrogenase-like Zn-dependent dehydrogenase
MKAVTWQGRRKVEYVDVPDPKIEVGTDAVIKVTRTNICGSDLHLYEVLGAFMEPGDVLGHEAMGVVEEVGDEVTAIKPGDRVVIPFQMSCGHCFMCTERLYSQCETTQVREHSSGAALFGYSKLYGEVPGGQAEYLRVPHAQFTHIPVPEGPPDERFVYLSDVLPTAWQTVTYADVKEGDSLAVFGLGPIGQMCVRVAHQRGVSPVIGVDLVPERLALARRYGAETIDASHEDAVERIVERTGGRGADAVIDAVGMEAHGAPLASLAQRGAGMLPDLVARRVYERAGIDRLSALTAAIKAVRRGGTLSITGVYGGAVDPLPMMELFDKGVQIRMGQTHVKRWVDEIMPLLLDGDPLGTEDLATHRMPLDEAPRAYELFQRKEDGAVKVLLRP